MSSLQFGCYTPALVRSVDYLLRVYASNALLIILRGQYLLVYGCKTTPYILTGVVNTAQLIQENGYEVIVCLSEVDPSVDQYHRFGELI